MGRIVVTGYPRSGTTWITSLLGDALGIPKRDLYRVANDYSLDLRRHPWYQDADDCRLTENCVVHSHERPSSQLVDFSAKNVHVVRDGRDVATSRWFFDTEFQPNNDLADRPETDFSTYVKEIASDWSSFVTTWLTEDPMWHRYEDFLSRPEFTLTSVLESLGLNVSSSTVKFAVAKNTPEKSRASFEKIYRSNSVVRKCEAGNWKEHFSSKDERTFMDMAGRLLGRLGYAI